MIGVALAAALGLTGCGGGPGSSSSTEQTASESAQQSLPPPSGEGCAAAGDTAALAELSLVEAVQLIPSAQTFATYLTADPSAEQQYASLGEVTAFIPVDSAWTKLDAAAAEQLQDPSWHRAVVEYALVPAELAPEAFAGEETSAMQTFRAPDAVLSGHMVGGTIVLNAQTNVVCSAIPFDGGLIYLTDTVMLPPS